MPKLKKSVILTRKTVLTVRRHILAARRARNGRLRGYWLAGRALNKALGKRADRNLRANDKAVTELGDLLQTSGIHAIRRLARYWSDADIKQATKFEVPWSMCIELLALDVAQHRLDGKEDGPLIRARCRLLGQARAMGHWGVRAAVRTRLRNTIHEPKPVRFRHKVLTKALDGLPAQMQAVEDRLGIVGDFLPPRKAGKARRIQRRLTALRRETAEMLAGAEKWAARRAKT